MYADRFAPPEGIKPGSLAIAIAINATLIGGLMFAAPVVETIRDRTIEIINIPIEPPPPPEPIQPETRPQPRPKSVSTAEQVDTSIAIEANADTGLVLPPLPPIPPGTMEGGGGVTVLDPTPPLPVLIEAGIDPRYAGLFQPDYPPGERRAEREGKVTIRVLIGADGRVKRAERVAAASDAFWRATEQRALTRWRFRPATRDGVAIESWRTMTVRFEMEM